jgi:hypothetical protein
MRKIFVLPLAAIVAAGFVACEEGPAGITPEAEVLTEIVLTQGVPAYAKPFNPVIAKSTMHHDSITVAGSKTTQFTVNGAGCTEFPWHDLVIHYRLTGNQTNEGSFDVYTEWTYGEAGFVGANAATVVTPSKQGDGDVDYGVPIKVRGGGAGMGGIALKIAPFGHQDGGGAQPMNLHRNIEATVQVEFSDCASANTPPSLTLPSDITEEARTSTGSHVNFTVSAEDAEDDDATLEIVCHLADDPTATAASGDKFGIGGHEISCEVTDSGGLTDNGTFWIYVQDTRAPEFTPIPTDQTLVADGSHGFTLGDPVEMFSIVARDWGPEGEAYAEISLPVTIGCLIGEEDAENQTIAIGETKTVVCTATDGATFQAPDNHAFTGNSAVIEFDVSVTLAVGDFCGFGTFEDGDLPAFDRPLRAAEPFSAHRQNSTIPFKVCAPNYADGLPATDLAGDLRFVLKHGTSVVFGTEDEPDVPAAGSTAWRYVESDNYYIFNAKSDRSWKTGAWEAEVSLGGITLGYGKFVMR